MNVRMGLLRKQPDWTIDQFLAYWRDKHGPLAARAPKLREYWQNAVKERAQGDTGVPRGDWQLDGFSQLFFDDTRQAHDAFTSSKIAAELIEDEHRFLGGLHIVTVSQHVVVPAPAAPKRAAVVKRISIITRRSELSEEDFRREWIAHRDLVTQMPGVVGYRQNFVIERERIKGQPCSYDELPIDGLVELWYEDGEARGTALTTSAGRATTEHAKAFLAEMTAFVVEERRVV